MLDKQKYFPLAALSGVTVRTILYPFSLIKTRLQVQKHSKLYLGTFDALRHIVKTDGLRGLYYGFCVNNLAMVSQMTFLTTYEAIRQRLTESQVLPSSRQRAFVAGGCASFVAQTIVVPIDVISQHLQMLPVRHGNLLKLNVCDAPGEQFTTRIGAARSVISGIYNQHGLGGFYKGYTMSVAMFAPTSAVWWFSYDLYCGNLNIFLRCNLYLNVSSLPQNVEFFFIFIASSRLGLAGGTPVASKKHYDILFLLAIDINYIKKNRTVLSRVVMAKRRR